ncbi:MAG: hypothetical protein DRN04_06305 [Thermoprotei archaeon]|nr:MAG: hypothetical protein DRN04_06305 [Thermoprotei archaeon]
MSKKAEGKYQNIINEKPIKNLNKPNINLVKIFNKYHNTNIYLLKLNEKIRTSIGSSKGKNSCFLISSLKTPSVRTKKVHSFMKKVHEVAIFEIVLINMLILVFFLVLLKNSVAKV